MTFDEFIRNFPGLNFTPVQVACIRYLERSGKRFCIDFGYKNAESIVWGEFDLDLDGPVN